MGQPAACHYGVHRHRLQRKGLPYVPTLRRALSPPFQDLNNVLLQAAEIIVSPVITPMFFDSYPGPVPYDWKSCSRQAHSMPDGKCTEMQLTAGHEPQPVLNLKVLQVSVT